MPSRRSGRVSVLDASPVWFLTDSLCQDLLKGGVTFLAKLKCFIIKQYKGKPNRKKKKNLGMAGHICNPGTGEPKAGGESKIEVSLDYQVKLSLPKHKPKQNQHSSSLKSFLGSQNFNTHWPQRSSGRLLYSGDCRNQSRAVQTPTPSSITPLGRKFCSHNP